MSAPMLAKKGLEVTCISEITRERVVLYFSHFTAQAEKGWGTRELELLAAIATMEQFQYYLDGQRFTLETDHNNLRWIMNIKNPQGRLLARWIARLSAFDVEFVYRKGGCNEVADCVSRNSLAARLAKVVKLDGAMDGAHSAINSAAREQALVRIREKKRKLENKSSSTTPSSSSWRRKLTVTLACLRSPFIVRLSEPKKKRWR